MKKHRKRLSMEDVDDIVEKNRTLLKVLNY